jgi:phage pi2 protein 07
MYGQNHEIDAIQDPNDPLLYYGYTKKFDYSSDTYVNHSYSEYDLIVKDKNLSIYHRGGLLYVPRGSILANIQEYANHYGASKLIDNNESISTKESNYYNYNYYLDTLSPDTSNRSVYVVSRIVEVKPDSNDMITIRKGGFVPYSKDEFGSVVENTTTIYNSGLLNRDNPEFSGSIGVLEFQIFVLGSPTNYSSINNDRVLSLTSALLNSNHSILTGSVESWSRNLNDALPCGNGIVEKDKYESSMSTAYSGRAKMKLELSKFYPNQGAIGVYYGMDKPIADHVNSDRYISSGKFFADDNASVNKYLKYVQLEDRVEEVITGVINGKGGWKYRYKGYYESNPDATSRYFVPTSLIIYCTNTADTSTISSFYFTYTFSHAPKVDIINCSKSEGSMSSTNTTISTTYSSYKDRVVFSSGIPATHYIMITGFNDKSVL